VITSTLLEEIYEQPTTLRRLIDAEMEPMTRLAQALHIRDCRYVVIAARGTSDNAARYAQYLIGATLGMPVALATPSLHTRYGAHLRFDGALVIGISQSGASPDICTVISDARRSGAPTIAITNHPESPLAQAAEFVVPIHAGIERSIAATKTYTAQLAALAMLTLSLANDTAGLAALATIPDAMEATLALDERMREIAGEMTGATAAITIGRGYHYATAWEIALKLKELTRVVAEPYSAADFQHGPIALVHEGIPIVLIANAGRRRRRSCRAGVAPAEPWRTSDRDQRRICHSGNSRSTSAAPGQCRGAFCADDCRDCRAVARLSPDICAGA
jgi:glucosamine--fructose-6-phosphate aminotransferase (isomerizing)